MATYAIGDVQGCYATLMKLVRRLRLGDDDRVWLAGDLVNRGPNSLDVLRWAREQGRRVKVVLGNHDIHLISRYHGIGRKKARDTLDEVLDAPDVDGLVDWLSHQPLLHREPHYLMVHAGILPDWTIDDAVRRAHGVEKALHGSRLEELLCGDHRASADLRVFTRLRCCHADGTLCDYDGPLAGAPPGCVPWFSERVNTARGPTIIFGHWSALGLYKSEKAIGLDTGCVWGRSLTAIRLDDRKVFSEPSREAHKGRRR